LPTETCAISLVVPVFNEAANIPILIAEIHAAMSPLVQPYEIIYVNDGSTDESLAVLQELARSDSRVRVFSHGHNAGQSAALTTGFRAARGKAIVTLDADLQNDPADIPRLLAVLEGCDVVSGVRQRRRDPWSRRASSRVANAVRNWVLREAIVDVGCALKVYRREVLDGLPLFDGVHRFLPTLTRWNGARVRELPVAHRPRRHGRSKYVRSLLVREVGLALRRRRALLPPEPALGRLLRRPERRQPPVPRHRLAAEIARALAVAPACPQGAGQGEGDVGAQLGVGLVGGGAGAVGALELSHGLGGTAKGQA
jgi:dolichol-phosphate mannosyltransferase